MPDSSDTFNILSTSAAFQTDLKRLVGKVSKQHVEELRFCTVFLFTDIKLSSSLFVAGNPKC